MPRAKKSLSSAVTHHVREVFLTALPIFLILIGAVYVYATGISWPQEPYAPTGLEAVFVGVSAAPYTTVFTNYANANDTACKNNTNATIQGSHICTADEIMHSYNDSVAAVLSQTGAAWINNGPPGHEQTPLNDCVGWTSKNPAQRGAIWNFTGKKASLMTCNVTTLPFACCK